jgi:small subunit ribosomal protein S17
MVENATKKEIKRRRLEGIVVSSKMEKTAVVKVEELKFHPKYKKYYRAHKKFKAENPDNKYKEGDKVVIEATRPLSKDKRWRIIGRA